MADSTTNKAKDIFGKVTGYVKANKKPLGIGAGTGFGVGTLLTLAITKIKGKKAKK